MFSLTATVSNSIEIFRDSNIMRLNFGQVLIIAIIANVFCKLVRLVSICTNVVF